MVDVKVFGPVHEYVDPVLVAFKLSVFPEQIELLLVATGEAGIRFIVTEVVPVLLTHPVVLFVTVTEYVPAAAVVTGEMAAGSSKVEVKLFGPLQEYVVPAMVLEKRDKLAPLHTGLLLVGDGVAGVVFTTTDVVVTGPVQPDTVTVAEYVPLAAATTLPIVGF